MRKKVIIGSISLVLLMIICIGIYYTKYKYNTGYNLTTEQKQSNIERLVSKYDYEGAKILAQNYYYADNNLDDYSKYSGLILVCKNNNLTSFKEADEQSKKNNEESEAKRKAKNKDNELFDSIGDEINSIGINNMTKEQCISYINRYMDYVINGGLEKDKALDNIIILKQQYGTLDTTDYNYKGIKCIKATVGMTEKEVKALTKYSNPERVNKTENKNGISKQYCFFNDYLYFDNGILTSIQS